MVCRIRSVGMGTSAHNILHAFVGVLLLRLPNLATPRPYFLWSGVLGLRHHQFLVEKVLAVLSEYEVPTDKVS